MLLERVGMRGVLGSVFGAILFLFLGGWLVVNESCCCSELV